MNGRIHDQAQWQANSGLSEGLVYHLIHILHLVVFQPCFLWKMRLFDRLGAS